MKNFTQNYSPKNQLNVEANPEKNSLQSPKRQSVEFILAYSKSVEGRSSKYMNEMLINLN